MQIQRVQNNNYKLNFGMKYPIIKTKNVSSDFSTRVEKCLDFLPDDWQKSLLRSNYKLYCSNSVQDTFDHLSLNEEAPDLDAVTCNHPIFKFFVFTPKIENNELQRVINHEISHGIVNSERLAMRVDYIQEICKDAENFSLGIPRYNNLYDIKNLLIKPLDDYRINEVFADIIAWAQKGGGLWGSGYKGGKINPNFLKENYPLTYAKLKDFKVNQEEVKQPVFVESVNEYYWERDKDIPF